MRRFLFTAFLAILAFLHSANGQDDKFYVEARPASTSVTAGAPFSIEYALKYKGRSLNLQHSGIQVKKPNLGAFEIVDEYRDNGMQFDFNMTDITIDRYTLVLKAKTQGKNTIGPVSFTLNGKTYSSPSIDIEVGKGDPAQSASTPEEKQASGPDPSKLFARMTVSKQSVYEGEQVIITHKVYSAVNLVSLGDVSFPGFEGFWSEEVPSTEVKLSNETIGGTTYRVVELKQHVIFPRNAGKLKIDPLKVECIVQEIRERPARNANERFFYGPMVRYRDNISYKIKSAPLTLDVRPLPETNRPAGFGGTVGSYTVTATVDNKSVLTNEAISLTFSVSGKGNLGKLQAPQFQFPPDFEVYDPKISASYKASGAGVNGSKSWTWLLIPRREGEYAIAPVDFHSFDPAKGTYNSVTIPAFRFDVGKGTHSGSMVSVSGTAQEDVQFIGQDIRFIHTGLIASGSSGSGFVGSIWFYLLWLLPPLLFGAYILFDRRRSTQESQISRVQGKAARKAGRKLKQSAGLAGKDMHAYYEKISEALLTYAVERFSIEKAGLTTGIAVQAMESAGAGPELAGIFREIVEECEYNRFSPSGRGDQESPLHGRSWKLIQELEKKIR